MKVTFFVQIVGCKKSRELWENIEHFGNVNVTDTGDKTLVYGEAYLEQASRIIYHCALFGDIMVQLDHSE